MTFFETEIKINPTFVASNRITIVARRYRKKNRRWYAELNTGFHSRTPLDSISGSRSQIKEFIKKHLK